MVVVLNSNSSQQEIDIALEKLNKSAEKNTKKHFDPYKYCGVIKLTEDPVVIQRRLRDEWE